MALIEEIDPPSKEPKSGSAEQTKILKFFTKIKHNLNIDHQLFSTLNRDSLGRAANSFFDWMRQYVLGHKYLPHIVIVLIAIVVAGTNLSQKIIAKAYYNDIVTVNPDTQFNIVSSVTPYTPLIKNGLQSVETSVEAAAVADGFALNAVSVATAVTTEEENGNVSYTTADPLDNSQKSIYYTVQNGDTLSGLGMKFNLKIVSIKYVNDITNENMIKPGMKLRIPKQGYVPTAAQIAAMEKSTTIASANRNTVTRSTTTTVKRNPGSISNAYPYGWCTYYVATKRYVPAQWGNARSWLSSAQRAGYSTGKAPAAGSIVVTGESGYGHVAYVESVSGGSITISEMNYKGWGVVSRRTISAYGGVIRGYIY